MNAPQPQSPFVEMRDWLTDIKAQIDSWLSFFAEVEDRLTPSATVVSHPTADAFVLQLVSEGNEPDGRIQRRPSTAPRARRAWTDEETARVVMLWLRNVPSEVIAAEVGRTSSGICHWVAKLRDSGMPLPRRDANGRNV